jgi:hypothetical protein
MDYAKKKARAFLRKLHDLMNTSQQIPSLYLSSHKLYYFSNLGPSFAINLRISRDSVVYLALDEVIVTAVMRLQFP